MAVFDGLFGEDRRGLREILGEIPIPPTLQRAQARLKELTEDYSRKLATVHTLKRGAGAMTPSEMVRLEARVDAATRAANDVQSQIEEARERVTQIRASCGYLREIEQTGLAFRHAKLRQYRQVLEASDAIIEALDAGEEALRAFGADSLSKYAHDRMLGRIARFCPE